jgi:hypothetical protein
MSPAFLWVWDTYVVLKSYFHALVTEPFVILQ